MQLIIFGGYLSMIFLILIVITLRIMGLRSVIGYSDILMSVIKIYLLMVVVIAIFGGYKILVDPSI